MIEHPGPLRAHADAVRRYLEEFAELDERRNFMVHAIMTRYGKAEADHRFRFAMFRPTKEGTDYGSMIATLSELDALADAVQPISTGVTQLVANILRMLDVPPIAVVFDAGTPSPFNLNLGGRV